MAVLQLSCNLTNTCQLTSVSPVASVTTLKAILLPKTSLKPSTLPLICVSSKLPKLCPKLIGATSKQWRRTTVCLFGGKGDSDNGNEGSPWKSLEKTIGNLKKDLSVEDVLRQQIKKEDYFDEDDDGGSGEDGPGGGGGGGGGSGDNFGESDEVGLPEILDELVQVIMATVAFIFVYIYIIEGEEVTRFAKDILKFVFTGQQSIRLKRVTGQLGSFLQKMRHKEPYDPLWLQRAIVNTETWWDGPSKYKYTSNDNNELAAAGESSFDYRDETGESFYEDNQEDNQDETGEAYF